MYFCRVCCSLLTMLVALDAIARADDNGPAQTVMMRGCWQAAKAYDFERRALRATAGGEDGIPSGYPAVAGGDRPHPRRAEQSSQSPPSNDGGNLVEIAVDPRLRNAAAGYWHQCAETTSDPYIRDWALLYYIHDDGSDQSCIQLRNLARLTQFSDVRAEALRGACGP